MELARVINEKKYMWDGKIYSTENERREIAQRYKDDGFEVENVDEESKFYLFTRRLVKEVIVDGKPI